MPPCATASRSTPVPRSARPRRGSLRGSRPSPSSRSRTGSLSDDGARQVAIALPSERLARLKLRGLRHLSDDRFVSLDGATPVIHKLSIASSSFGP